MATSSACAPAKQVWLAAPSRAPPRGTGQNPSLRKAPGASRRQRGRCVGEDTSTTRLTSRRRNLLAAALSSVRVLEQSSSGRAVASSRDAALSSSARQKERGKSRDSLLQRALASASIAAPSSAPVESSRLAPDPNRRATQVGSCSASAKAAGTRPSSPDRASPQTSCSQSSAPQCTPCTRMPVRGECLCAARVACIQQATTATAPMGSFP
eukprot:6072554-Prymnesium_polylepis.1